MSAEELEHAFDRFARARRRGHGGTGLGLSIVKSLVELQGGSIEVRARWARAPRSPCALPAEPERRLP